MSKSSLLQYSSEKQNEEITYDLKAIPFEISIKQNFEAKTPLIRLTKNQSLGFNLKPKNQEDKKQQYESRYENSASQNAKKIGEKNSRYTFESLKQNDNVDVPKLSTASYDFISILQSRQAEASAQVNLEKPTLNQDLNLLEKQPVKKVRIQKINDKKQPIKNFSVLEERFHGALTLLKSRKIGLERNQISISRNQESKSGQKSEKKQVCVEQSSKQIFKSPGKAKDWIQFARERNQTPNVEKSPIQKRNQQNLGTISYKLQEKEVFTTQRSNIESFLRSHRQQQTSNQTTHVIQTENVKKNKFQSSNMNSLMPSPFTGSPKLNARSLMNSRKTSKGTIQIDTSFVNPKFDRINANSSQFQTPNRNNQGDLGSSYVDALAVSNIIEKDQKDYQASMVRGQRLSSDFDTCEQMSPTLAHDSFIKKSFSKKHKNGEGRQSQMSGGMTGGGVNRRHLVIKNQNLSQMKINCGIKDDDDDQSKSQGAMSISKRYLSEFKDRLDEKRKDLRQAHEKIANIVRASSQLQSNFSQKLNKLENRQENQEKYRISLQKPLPATQAKQRSNKNYESVEKIKIALEKLKDAKRAKDREFFEGKALLTKDCIGKDRFWKKDQDKQSMTERKQVVKTVERDVISPENLFKDNKVISGRTSQSESRLKKGKLKPLSMEHFFFSQNILSPQSRNERKLERDQTDQVLKSQKKNQQQREILEKMTEQLNLLPRTTTERFRLQQKMINYTKKVAKPVFEKSVVIGKEVSVGVRTEMFDRSPMTIRRDSQNIEHLNQLMASQWGLNLLAHQIKHESPLKINQNLQSSQNQQVTLASEEENEQQWLVLNPILLPSLCSDLIQDDDGEKVSEKQEKVLEQHDSLIDPDDPFVQENHFSKTQTIPNVISQEQIQSKNRSTFSKNIGSLVLSRNQKLDNEFIGIQGHQISTNKRNAHHMSTHRKLNNQPQVVENSFQKVYSNESPARMSAPETALLENQGQILDELKQANLADQDYKFLRFPIIQRTHRQSNFQQSVNLASDSDSLSNYAPSALYSNQVVKMNNAQLENTNNESSSKIEISTQLQNSTSLQFQSNEKDKQRQSFGQNMSKQNLMVKPEQKKVHRKQNSFNNLKFLNDDLADVDEKTQSQGSFRQLQRPPKLAITALMMNQSQRQNQNASKFVKESQGENVPQMQKTRFFKAQKAASYDFENSPVADRLKINRQASPSISPSPAPIITPLQAKFNLQNQMKKVKKSSRGNHHKRSGRGRPNNQQLLNLDLETNLEKEKKTGKQPRSHCSARSNQSSKSKRKQSSHRSSQRSSCQRSTIIPNNHNQTNPIQQHIKESSVIYEHHLPEQGLVSPQTQQLDSSLNSAEFDEKLPATEAKICDTINDNLNTFGQENESQHCRDTPSKRKQIYLSVSLASNEFTVQQQQQNPTFTAQVDKIRGANQGRDSQDMDCFEYDLKKDYSLKKATSNLQNQQVLKQILLPKVFALDKSIDASPQSHKAPSPLISSPYRRKKSAHLSTEKKERTENYQSVESPQMKTSNFMKIIVTQRKIKAQQEKPKKMKIFSQFTDLFQVKSDEKIPEFDGLQGVSIKPFQSPTQFNVKDVDKKPHQQSQYSVRQRKALQNKLLHQKQRQKQILSSAVLMQNEYPNEQEKVA